MRSKIIEGFLVAILFLMVFSALSNSLAGNRVINSKVQAEKYMEENNKDAAKKFFIICSDFAEKDGNWEQIIPAGFGLAHLKYNSDSQRLWGSVRDLAFNQDNLRGVLLASNGLAYVGAFKEALEAADLGLGMTKRQENLEGLYMVGQSFASIGSSSKAYKIALELRERAIQKNDWEGILRAGQLLQRLNRDYKARSYFKNARIVAQELGKDQVSSFKQRINYKTDTLLIQEKGLYYPGLAKNWEFSSPRSLVLKIRNNIKCFNGNFLQPADVLFSYQKNLEKWQRLGISSAELMDDGQRIHLTMDTYMVGILSHPDTYIQCTGSNE